MNVAQKMNNVELRRRFFRQLSQYQRLQVFKKLGVIPKGYNYFLPHQHEHSVFTMLLETGRHSDIEQMIVL